MTVTGRHHEWLEADGLGGYAMGTVGGLRTRRYHALLVTATTPPTGRVVLVHGFDAFVETAAGRFAISSQRYADGTVAPDGADHLAGFEHAPWPRWTFRLPDGTRLTQELVVPRGSPAVVLTWTSSAPAALEVRPLLSGRDDHALHHENGELRFDAQVAGNVVRFQPYAAHPPVLAVSNGEYRHDPHWYRSFLYAEERARGLDHVEDLAAPGLFRFALAPDREASLVFAAGAAPSADVVALRAAERRRRDAFPTPLHRAADAYIVRRGSGSTVVAGYPWFTDWGRDTFIALRGLCLATGRLDEAGDILAEWAGAVDEGMLPNRFPDRGDAAEFNAVDASLWYVVAVHEFLETAPNSIHRPRLLAAVDAILDGYTAGTRHGIRCDADGLLAAGEPGWQLTWMDARVQGREVTPRIGKPVEIQALWLSALKLYRPERFEAAHQSFLERFWDEERGALHDVVDVDHEAGTVDGSIRPNQVLAVGGLPVALLDGERARRLVENVERRLWTPLGLRTLAPGSDDYVGRYEGGVDARDGAYHQGAAWPWLLGPFVEAWVRVNGRPEEACARFLEPLLRHLDEAGRGHVSELADGEAPFAPRGCPFQAWSLGELLRLQLVVLARPRSEVPAATVAIEAAAP